MAQNLQKRPSKSILKTSRSVDGQDISAAPTATPTAGTPSTSKRPKEQRFDEMNIMETFHPANKDYGHMKVDEPKTPYSESVDGDLEPADELDANILAAKLAASMNKPPKCTEHDEACESDEDMEEPEDVRRKRKEFEKKRKMHYNEFQALQLARQLMQQEEEEENEDTSAHQKT